MKFYELTYLISGKISEEELKNLQEKINSLIEKEGGVLYGLKGPSQQKLAYPIKKETEVFILSLTFHLLKEKVKSLENRLKKIPEILRFLLLTKKVTKIEITPKRTLSKTISQPKFGPKIKKEKKVELEEIEKKLEEILNE